DEEQTKPHLATDLPGGGGGVVGPAGANRSPAARAEVNSSTSPRTGSLMEDVTHILQAIDSGVRQAADRLLPLGYDELPRSAAARLAAGRPDHSQNAPGLDHEASLRLVGEQRFDSRGHFFAAAAEAMRRILVDRARRRAARKRGGAAGRVPLENVE